MTRIKQWRGLKDLAIDAVSQGAEAVRKVQLESLERTTALLERVPALELPVKAVRAVHTVAVTASHTGIQVVTAAVGAGLDVALAVAEKAAPDAGSPVVPNEGSTSR